MVGCIGVGARGVWALFWAPLVATAGMAAVLLPIEDAIGSPWPALWPAASRAA